jgi:hypothetical protein
MPKGALLAVLFLMGGMIGACGGGGGDSFSDKLTVGLGITGTGFDLAGEGTTFSVSELGSSSLWFRLESAADLDGRFVRIYIDSLGNDGSSAPYGQKDYEPPQAYGHIFLSTFRITDPGSYRLRGFHVKTVIDIGEETHVADTTLSMIN